MGLFLCDKNDVITRVFSLLFFLLDSKATKPFFLLKNFSKVLLKRKVAAAQLNEPDVNLTCGCSCNALRGAMLTEIKTMSRVFLLKLTFSVYDRVVYFPTAKQINFLLNEKINCANFSSISIENKRCARITVSLLSINGSL